jgi:hypothetical protein
MTEMYRVLSRHTKPTHQWQCDTISPWRDIGAISTRACPAQVLLAANGDVAHLKQVSSTLASIEPFLLQRVALPRTPRTNGTGDGPLDRSQAPSACQTDTRPPAKMEIARFGSTDDATEFARASSASACVWLRCAQEQRRGLICRPVEYLRATRSTDGVDCRKQRPFRAHL